MKNKNNTKKIEDYLDGIMQEDAKKEFEKVLSSNPELQKELEMHQQIRKAVKLKARNDLKKEISKYQSQQRIQKKSILMRLLIPAISAAAILFFAYLFIKQNDNKANRQDQFITLDSTGLNKTPEYADSASFSIINSDSSAQMIPLNEKK